MYLPTYFSHFPEHKKFEFNVVKELSDLKPEDEETADKEATDPPHDQSSSENDEK